MMKVNFLFLALLALLFAVSQPLLAQLPEELMDTYELVYSDDFDYPNEDLEANWTIQNGPSGHILSGRYRENVSTEDGNLLLHYRKETINGQDWTSGNMWTNEEYRYGYFECRYKIAAAGATNNSFWIMNRSFESIVPPGRGFELDINEGHYPNEINTNIHMFDEGFTNRSTDAISFAVGITPDVNLPLEIPITTKKIRFSSNNAAHFHIREFRVYDISDSGYPEVLSETADTDIDGLVNHARAPGTSISVSGLFDNTPDRGKDNMIDGQVIQGSWVSQTDGPKWFEMEWTEEKTIGCIQFVNGWGGPGGWGGPEWQALISDYKIEYWDGEDWVPMASLDSATDFNLAEEFHVYAMKWDENEFVWYFDGQEIRRTPNTHAYGFAPVWLSGAVVEWSGPVTDEIDGTNMVVDYVRIYQATGNPSATAEELSKENGVNVFPNPANATLNVELGDLSSKASQLQIFDSQGRLISALTRLGERFSMDIGDLPIGSYILRIVNDEFVVSRKFIKQ